MDDHDCHITILYLHHGADISHLLILQNLSINESISAMTKLIMADKHPF
jgi:hypothetical protein